MALTGTLGARLRRLATPFMPAAKAPCPEPRQAGAQAPVQDFAGLERLQREGPVHRLKRGDNWLVLSYDAVDAVLGNPGLYSSSPQRVIDPVLLGADPPEHSRARKALAPLFAADNLAPILAEAAEQARSLIGPELDAVNDFAVPLTSWLGRRFLGTDEARFDRISRAARALHQSVPLSEPIDLGFEVRQTELYGRLAGDSEAGLSNEQAASLVSLLATASAETTERLIARCVLILLEQPELRAQLLAQETAMAPFVDGVLRLFPPEPMLVREATGSATLAGVAIQAGAELRLSVAAANRDPARFDAPHALRLDGSKPHHFSFGGGPHQCIGAGLGRRIASVAIATLLEQAPRFEAAEPLDQVDYHVVGGRLLPERLLIRSGLRADTRT